MSEDLPLHERLQNYYRRSDKDFQISGFTPISDGWETEVYSFVLTLRHQSVPCILRMYPGANAAAKCEREYEGMDSLWNMRYPVPHVMRHETEAIWLGKPFIVMQRINGRPLGQVMIEDTVRQAELLTRFVQLFVDLHRVKDYRPDLVNFTDYKPSIYTPVTIAAWRKTIVDAFHQTWVVPILDWFDSHSVGEAPQISPLHGDFHPNNVLLTLDNKLYVIDWSGFSVGDYRRDLAWTLMLLSTQGYEHLRPIILSQYEWLSGHPVEQIEYFDVVAALRRLFDFAVSVGSGAETLGMRPETAAVMRQQRGHYQQVYDLLRVRTGLRLPEIERLIK